MHDKLFQNQAALSTEGYQQWAKEIGLDLDRFQRSLSDPRAAQRIQDDSSLGAGIGAAGTPTFFINGERVVGAALRKRWIGQFRDHPLESPSLSVKTGDFWQGASPAPRGFRHVSPLKRILRDLTREIDRLAERNELLERRLQSITGALQGRFQARPESAPRTSRVTGGRRRRGAPTKFNAQQAMQLRRDYEAGATSARLARKYRAALPTILSTLRRAGATLRRGRPPKK